MQVSSSERLRVQVWALKSLLEADGGKLRLALRELQRLKQLLHDRDAEKALLEKVGLTGCGAGILHFNSSLKES